MSWWDADTRFFGNFAHDYFIYIDNGHVYKCRVQDEDIPAYWKWCKHNSIQFPYSVKYDPLVNLILVMALTYFLFFQHALVSIF